MKKIIVLLASIFTISIANAQWVQTNGPNGGVWINCIAVNGNSMYAGTYNNGIYLSTNYGASWTAINNGLSNRNIATFMFSGNTILAGGGNNSSGESSNGIMISTNNGNSWTMVNDSILKLLAIYAFALKDSSILALTNSGLFTSNDNGNNWTMINSDFPSSVDVSSIVVSGNNIFVGTLSYGVLLSTNNGSNWVAMNT